MPTWQQPADLSCSCCISNGILIGITWATGTNSFSDFSGITQKKLISHLCRTSPEQVTQRPAAPSLLLSTIPEGLGVFEFRLWNRKKEVEKHTVFQTPWSFGDIICFIPLVGPRHVTHLDARGAGKFGAWLGSHFQVMTLIYGWPCATPPQMSVCAFNSESHYRLSIPEWPRNYWSLWPWLNMFVDRLWGRNIERHGFSLEWKRDSLGLGGRETMVSGSLGRGSVCFTSL